VVLIIIQKCAIDINTKNNNIILTSTKFLQSFHNGHFTFYSLCFFINIKFYFHNNYKALKINYNVIVVTDYFPNTRYSFGLKVRISWMVPILSPTKTTKSSSL